MCDFGKAIVVTTDELDMYSAKKLKNKGIMKGKILAPILSFSSHRGLWGTSVVCSVSSFVDPTMEYSTPSCSVGLACAAVTIYSLSKIA